MIDLATFGFAFLLGFFVGGLVMVYSIRGHVEGGLVAFAGKAYRCTPVIKEPMK